MDSRPTERFTNRVDNYVRYRPDYPAGLIPLLEREISLTPSWTIADIGSGPGNLTRRFLEFGATVYGVEPNEAMRLAGEELMGNDPGFISVAGSAESTTLPDVSVDLVSAGQAFHWFDPERSRVEFQRILRAPGWVALIWNRRSEETSAMLDEYGAMLRRYSAEYTQVNMQADRARDGMEALFGSGGYRSYALPHQQLLDFDAFWGRLLSSSYTPLPGDPGHQEIYDGCVQIFDKYAEDGILRFPYETQMFVGTLLADI